MKNGTLLQFPKKAQPIKTIDKLKKSLDRINELMAQLKEIAASGGGAALSEPSCNNQHLYTPPPPIEEDVNGKNNTE